MKPTPGTTIRIWRATLVVALLAALAGYAQPPGGGIAGGAGGGPGGGRFGQPSQPKTLRVDPDDDPAALRSAQGPMVVAIEVVGNKSVSRERIEGLVRTRAGRAYNDIVAKADLGRLMAQSLFYDATIEIRDVAEGRIVRFRVLERPLIQAVEFVGNTVLSQDKLVEITGLRAGKAMDPALNKSAAAEIERKYREKGYPFAVIELVEGGKQDDSRVVVRISEGPATKVGSIRFEGVQFINHAVLKTKLKSGQFLGVGRVGFGGGYDPELIDEDIDALRRYYRANGFLDVKISHRKDFSDDKSRVYLTYMIEEGPRFRIGDVRIAGAKRFEEGKLKETILLAGGKSFNEAELRKDAQGLKDTFGRNGFVNAEVQPDLKFRDEPGVVDVVFKVQEDQPKYVGGIRIEGNTHTKKSVILKWMDLESGTLLDSTKLRDAQIRLMSSRLFDEQNPPEIVFDDASFDPSNPYQDLVVKLREGATGSLMFGVGVNSDAGVGGSLVLNERNFDLFRFPTSWADLWSGSAFRGGGQELRMEAVPGDLVHRYAITHLEPFLFGTDLNLQSSGYYYRRLFNNYAEQRTGGRFTLGYRIDRYWQASLGLRLEDVNISRPSVPTPAELTAALGSHFLYGPRVALSHDTRDSQMNPTKGHFVELGYEKTFGDYDFSRFDVSVRQYFKMYERRDGSGRHVLSVRGQFGWTDESTPIFERFYAGGFQTLRGFSFRGIGPVVFDQKVGGSFMLLSGLEYYLPLTADDNVGWVFFSDMGTIERKLEILDYRVTAGFGLRVRVPGMGPVPLAFDFAFPIAKTALDDTQVFSFSVGVFR